MCDRSADVGGLSIRVMSLQVMLRKKCCINLPMHDWIFTRTEKGGGRANNLQRAYGMSLLISRHAQTNSNKTF